MFRMPLMGLAILCSVDCVTMHTTCPVCPHNQSLLTPKPIVTAITITVTYYYSMTGSIEPKIRMSSRRIALCLGRMLFFPALNFICLIQSVLAGWIKMGIVLQLVICTYAVWPSPTSLLSWISADWLHSCHPRLLPSWSLRQLTLIMQLSMPGLLHNQSTIN